MARSDSLWLDSDIILDWLAARQPWDAAATEIIERAVLGEWVLWISPLTLANVHHIYRKHAGATNAMAAIQTLTSMALIATMDSSHVRQAIGAVDLATSKMKCRSPAPARFPDSPPSSLGI